MKINEETTISEEQVLFNKLSYEEQQFILKQMRMLQPCELECKKEEEKKIPEKLKVLNANEYSKELYYENYSKEEIVLDIETLQNWVNKIIDYLDYLKSKGE